MFWWTADRGENEMVGRWIYLSHLLLPSTPAYRGSQSFFDDPDKQMDRGDSCNTRNWRLSNHAGTHIDFPRHFAVAGSVLEAYDAEFWVMGQVQVVTLPEVAAGEIITPDALTGLDREAQLLLIKTGFGQWRGETAYWQASPGFHPELAEHIRSRMPQVRMVGMDVISLSSFAHRDLGREAHRAFLDHPRPLLLLEDLDLSAVRGDARFDQVVVAPLRVGGADGAPCTVMGRIAGT